MANDINKYKNIIQHHEDSQVPNWNKKANWTDIESNLSSKRFQKVYKGLGYLAFLLVGMSIGWILKPTQMYHTPINLMDKIPDTLVKELRLIDTIIVNKIDTLVIAKNRAVQKYDTVYIVKESPNPILIAIEVDSQNLTPDIQDVNVADELKGISQLTTNSITSREDPIQKSEIQAKPKYTQRTNKEYAPYVFIKDTVKTKSIEFEFDLFRRRQYYVNKLEKH